MNSDSIAAGYWAGGWSLPSSASSNLLLATSYGNQTDFDASVIGTSPGSPFVGDGT